MTSVDDSLQHHNREASNTKYDMTGFTVQVATREQWKQVTEWGNGENWNIGFHDPECFMPVDPDGFFIGLMNGEPVSAVSLVNYSDDFAVWGHYLVAPGQRGSGYGIEVCKVASRHAGDRVTAGDAMPEQVENYSKDGSRPAHRTIHYLGKLNKNTTADKNVRDITSDDLTAVAEYDATAFPAYREVFLTRWLYAEGHRAVAYTTGDEITGYGVIRPAPVGYRIGPLTANTTDIAQAVLDTLLAEIPQDTPISVFAPDLQPAMADMLRDIGLEEHFHVFRMYRGDVPDHQTERVYAIASLELG